MRPIGREMGSGFAQRGRSLISTIALLVHCSHKARSDHMQLQQSKMQSHNYIRVKTELVDNRRSIQYRHKLTNIRDKHHTIVTDNSVKRG